MIQTNSNSSYIKNGSKQGLLRGLLIIVYCLLFHYSSAQQSQDTLCVFKNNGAIEMFPREFIIQESYSDYDMKLLLKGGVTLTYDMSDIDSISNSINIVLPRILSFNIYKENNHNLIADANGIIEGDSLISVSVAAIGRYLTASFSTSHNSNLVTVEGITQENESTRLKFDGDVVYIVSDPNICIYSSNADNSYSMTPLGRKYIVRVDWLTEHSTSVPRIDIYTDDNTLPSSKEVYQKAYITIDGAGVYPSMSDSVMIRGRGNSSWNQNNPNDKNPYRLKFENKVKPFGLTKGKNWVLLANKIKGSMTSNAIAFEIARLVGSSSANHLVPVELYINGSYRGNYNFTEKIGFSNNSIDLDDESSAVLLELDTNYDEVYKFKSVPYSLSVNIKEPDLDADDTLLSFEIIKREFNEFCAALKAGEDISMYVDFDALAKFMLVQDLTRNAEIHHPKSTFLYKEFLGKDSKYIFGPVWDFDWGFGKYFIDSYETPIWNENSSQKGSIFFHDLSQVPQVADYYCKIWKDFYENQFDELLDYCDDYYKYTAKSFEHNATIWNDNTDYAKSNENAKQWLTKRAIYINNSFPSDIIGDVNQDKLINITDVSMLTQYILGDSSINVSLNNADVNNDGKINVTDVILILNSILEYSKE